MMFYNTFGKNSVVGVLVVSVLLGGCATTNKSISPEQEVKIKENQANYEKSNFTVIHQNQVKVGDGVASLILRETVPATEPELTIVKRNRTVGVNTVLAASALLGAIPATGAGKESFKGKILEPSFKNPILNHAQPAFSTWLSANVAKFAPNDKPISEVAVTAKRFNLIYPKLIGKESYQLNTELLVRFKNNWDNRTAFTHLCDIKSEAKSLETWQANNYQAVDNAVKENIQTCLKELDSKASDIKKHFSK